MNRLRSAVAVAELEQLQRQEVKTAVISFAETASIHTAAWAVGKFGGQVLVDRVQKNYYETPEVNEAGQAIHIEDLRGETGARLTYEQGAAEDLAADIAKDLRGAIKRISRGYVLDTATVRGVDDTLAVIGSLEKAVEVNPENLDSGEQHFQAAAAYMLEHMVSQQEGAQREYLL